MVCFRNPMLQMTMTLFLVGLAMGQFVVGYFNDKYGRKLGALISLMISIMSNTIGIVYVKWVKHYVVTMHFKIFVKQFYFCNIIFNKIWLFLFFFIFVHIWNWYLVPPLFSSYYCYCATRLINGFAFGGSANSMVVLNNEMNGSKGRGLAVAIYSAGFALGKLWSKFCFKE